MDIGSHGPLSSSRPPDGSDSSPSGLFLILMLVVMIGFVAGLFWLL
ncbi:hypothetical protein [Halosimplex salinum]|nr:hypothetical protein [Halosimplex salinum]